MEYPFDISFTTEHPELTLWTPRPALDTATYNAASQTLDFSHSGNVNGILLLRDTPPVPTLTFGAEISFTENIPNTATGNYFGFWACVNPEVDYLGFVPYHRNDSSPAPAGNGWGLSTTTASATFTTPALKVLDGVNGVPAFSAGTWYDIRLEYFANPMSASGGAALIRFFVNDIQIFETRYTDQRALGVTPGFYGYNSKYKVRRIYGSRDTSFDYTVKVHTEQNTDAAWIDPAGTNDLPNLAATDDGYFNYVYSEDLVIRGRVLDESFQPSVELVYAYETSTMRPVHRVISDADGFYSLDKLDSKYNYTVMVAREGKMRTIPLADYTGFGGLAGVYRIRGDNVGEVEVRVLSELTGEYLGKVMTDVNGQFSIPNVNKLHPFTLVFREPSGAWEDRVSSRRFPETVGGTLTFANTIADNEHADGIIGKVVISGGIKPYTVEVTGLPPGIYHTLTGDTVNFFGTSSVGGTYSVTVAAQSIDDYTGTTNATVQIASGFDGNVPIIGGETMSAVMAATISTTSQNFATDPGAIGTWADTYSDSGNLSTAWQSAGTMRITSASYNDALILKDVTYEKDRSAIVQSTIVNPNLGNSAYIGFFAIPETSADNAICAIIGTAADSIYIFRSNAQNSPSLQTQLSQVSVATPRSGTHKYEMRFTSNAPGTGKTVEILIDDVLVVVFNATAAEIPSDQKYKMGMFIRSSSHDVHLISTTTVK